MEFMFLFSGIMAVVAAVVGAYLNKHFSEKSGKQKYIVLTDNVNIDRVIPKIDDYSLDKESRSKLEEIILAQINKIELEDRRYHYQFTIKGKQNECSKVWDNLRNNDELRKIVGVTTFSTMGSWLPFTETTAAISIYCSKMITPNVIHDLVLGYDVSLMDLGLILFSRKN